MLFANLFANDFFIPRGDLMAGYSYFSYDQMTLLGIDVHSDELELLQQAARCFPVGRQRCSRGLCDIEREAIRARFP